MPPLAELSDLEVRLGRAIGPGEVERAEAVLVDVSALARAEGRRSWWSEDEGLNVPPAVLTVVLSAAKRAVDNPGGLVSETVGPFSRRIADDRGSGVFLTEAEAAVVRRFRPRSTGLWTQRTTRLDPHHEHSAAPGTAFLEDQFGCELFPVGSYDEGVW